MHPLHIVSMPFEWVGIDTVGPLSKTTGGHTHILVVVDYTTQYPEAVVLQSTTTPVLARQLATIFSRVSFPRQILTDQGTNFMGQVMQQLWHTMGIHGYTTPKPMDW